jgi:hypothetical protein
MTVRRRFLPETLTGPAEVADQDVHRARGLARPAVPGRPLRSQNQIRRMGQQVVTLPRDPPLHRDGRKAPSARSVRYAASPAGQQPRLPRRNAEIIPARRRPNQP